MENRSVKMSDIAKELNISIVTVSKALNNKDGVGDELREKIKHLATQMGYQPKVKANFSDSSYTIGIIVAEHFIKPNHSYYWSQYQSLVECFKQYGIYNLFEIIKTDDMQNNILPGIISNTNLDGIIVLGNMDKEYLAEIQTYGKPMVILDAYASNIINSTSIISDNYTSCFRLVDYLCTMGHKNIGFLGSVSFGSNIQDKYFGYRKGLLNNQLDYNEEWIIDDRDNFSFKTEFKLPKNMPTAFICNCDEAAFHFIAYLNSKGYAVPEDVSVVGFYNYIYATLCYPPLTTMEVNMNKIAKTTAKTIQKLIKGEKCPEIMSIGCDIILRSSVRNLQL